MARKSGPSEGSSATQGSAKPPRSHIVRHESEEKFLAEVAEFFTKGYRPLQDMKTFAAFDRKKGEWRVLYVMPLVHFAELREFQSVPQDADKKQEERMFG